MDPITMTAIASGAGQAAQGIANWFSQADTLKWQKKMQKKQWSREDQAVQRRVADLRAAGLSPTLAAGSAASSSPPVKLEAPQLRGVGESIGKGIEVKSAMQDIAMKQAAIDRTQAEIAYTNARTSGVLKENRYIDDLRGGRVKQYEQENWARAIMNPLKISAMVQDIHSQGIRNATQKLKNEAMEYEISMQDIRKTYEELRNKKELQNIDDNDLKLAAIQSQIDLRKEQIKYMDYKMGHKGSGVRDTLNDISGFLGFGDNY